MSWQVRENSKVVKKREKLLIMLWRENSKLLVKWRKNSKLLGQVEGKLQMVLSSGGKTPNGYRIENFKLCLFYVFLSEILTAEKSSTVTMGNSEGDKVWYFKHKTKLLREGKLQIERVVNFCCFTGIGNSEGVVLGITENIYSQESSMVCRKYHQE